MSKPGFKTVSLADKDYQEFLAIHKWMCNNSKSQTLRLMIHDTYLRIKNRRNETKYVSPIDTIMQVSDNLEHGLSDIMGHQKNLTQSLSEGEL